MFAMSVVIWFLSSFNLHGFTENINDSLLASFGKILAPIFAPLGFKDWRISVSILTGLGAKEIVVNTMSVLFGSNLSEVLPTVFTGVTALSFLAFSALYTPCIAALATMRKEYGNKMMMISLIYQFLLAWIVALLVNVIGNVLLGNSASIEYIIGGIIVIIAAFILFRMFKNKSNDNSGCSGCSSCPSSSSCHAKVTSK